MFRPFRIILILIIPFIGFSCKNQVDLNDKERFEIASEVKRLDESRFYRDEDITPERNGFYLEQLLQTDDPVWTGTPALYINTGNLRNATEGHSQDKFREIEVISGLEIYNDIPRNYAVLSKRCVVSTTNIKFSYFNKEGVRTPLNKWLNTKLWVKKGKEWKLVHHHTALVKNYGLIY